MVNISEERINKSLKKLINQSMPPDGVYFWWLGQSGFAFRSGNTLLLIDPYLSDSLAIKYADHEFKHSRMMPPPIDPREVTGCDWYLCTHAHTDHMDPTTIHNIRQSSNPNFVIPRAETEMVENLGIPKERILSINAFESIKLAHNISVEAIPSAHEELVRDDEGNCLYLGYIISINGIRIYHSGDTIAYSILAETLEKKKISIAFLPINGRDKYLSSKGIPGNMNVEEAIVLCHSVNIRNLVCHHFEMFQFNTIDRKTAREKLIECSTSLNWVLPKIGITYCISLNHNIPNGDSG